MSAPPSDRRPPAVRAPDLDALSVRLASLGLPLRAQADGTLVILVPAGPLPAIDTALRGRLVTLAREAGFTHVALELLADAAVSEGGA